VTAGFEIRYNRDQISAAGGKGLLDMEQTFEAWLPRFTLNYSASDQHMMYATVAKGNKPGGFNARFIANFVDPEEDIPYEESTAWNYELGLKSNWWDHRITTNLAAYYIDWTNQHLTSVVDLENGFANSVIQNVGESTVTGFEFDMQVLLTQYWDFSMGFAYTDTEVEEYLIPRTCLGGAGCLPGSTDFTSSYRETLQIGYHEVLANGDLIVSGREMPQVSKYQSVITNTFHYPLADWGEWFFRADVSYRSKRYASVSNLAHTGNATIINLRSGISSDLFDLELWVKNLGDDDTPSQLTRFIQWTESVAPSRAFGVTLPAKRQLGVTARYRF
jgi:outer membrane receptor protein involved in Fe transport